MRADIKEVSELPEGWKSLSVDSLGKAITGNTPPTKDSANYGGDIPFIKPTELIDRPVSIGRETISKKGAEKARILPKGGVLVSCIGNLGKTAIAIREVAFNQQINAIVFNETVIPEYGFYYFQTVKFRKDLELLASATTISIVNKSKFESIYLPIAPIEQQKQIVAKIEQLFSHIDAGIEALNTAKQRLKQYRQSVLKAAVTGELTKEWREENKSKLEPASQLLERILLTHRQKWEEQQLEQFEAKGKIPKNDKWKEKYKEAPSPRKSDLPIIPANWKWVTLQQVFDVITDGDHQAPPKSDNGVPFLVIGNVNKGVLEFGGTRFVPREYFDNLSEIRTPRKGNILYTVVGSYGIPVKVDSDKEFCVQRHIAILKASKEMSLDYLYHILSSGFVFKQATDVATGTAQKTVPLGGLREICIPLPPISEQLDISQTIDIKLSAMSRLNNEIDIQLKKSKTNKQSILASAFSGKLCNG